MIDNRFYQFYKTSISYEDLLNVDSSIRLFNKKQDEVKITGIATLKNAKHGDLSFFTKPILNEEKRKKQLKDTKASFVIIPEDYVNINDKVISFISNNSYLTFLNLCSNILKERDINYWKNNIQKDVKIADYVDIGCGVEISNGSIIESFVKISNGVKIGKNCIIKSGVKIGKNCIIGDNCQINENCTIQFAEIGNNCCIHSNSTIGQDGFGYITDNHKNTKIPHFSYVKLGNDVEIGSNTCIDRGVFEPTKIEDNVKIDNLVQIAHNVVIKKNSIVCGQTGIAGEAKIGENCLLGARSGILNNISIGDNSIIHSSSLVTKDFPKNSKIIGNPAEDYSKWTKKHAKINIFVKKS